jgi:competence protein ComEC
VRLFTYLKHRPFICLTLLFIAVIIILDKAGYYSAPRHPDISDFISPARRSVTARVSSSPVVKKDKTAIQLEVSEVDGRRTGGRLLLYSRGNGYLEPGNTISFETVIRRPARSYKGFDYALYLQRQGIYAVAYSGRVQVSGYSPPALFSRAAAALSNDVREKIRAALPGREADVLGKMVIGDSSGISEEDKRRFTDAGVMHVLVVSGLNVAYVVLLFAAIFRLTGLRPRKAALFTLPFIILYAAATGANPPVVRASVMAVFVILSYALSREPDVYQALSLAAFFILAAQPQSLFTPSFQLSFVSTAGIVYLYPRLAAFFKGFPRPARWLMNTAAVSVSAQLAVDPLLACYFGKLSLAGLVSNIIIVPLSGIITVAGLAFYLISVFLPWLSGLAAAANYHLVRLVLFFVDFFSGLKYASIQVPAPPPLFIIVYYIGIAVIFDIIHTRTPNENPN